MILLIEILVIALVNCGAGGSVAATASTGTSRVGCAGLAVGTAGVGAGVGLAGAIGSTGLGVGVASTVGGSVVAGTVVVGGSGTPGSSSYVTTGGQDLLPALYLLCSH